MSKQTKPLSIIYNQNSGFHANQKEDGYEEILHIFSAHDFEIQSFEISEFGNFANFMSHVLARHQQLDNHGVVVVAGGDGTLNAVAQYLMGTSIPMGILPLGTFNYVARVLDIPLQLKQAAEVIVQGLIRETHVASINNHIYLNNASLGLYPLFIKKREIYNQRFGRFPVHAYTSGLDVLIRDRKELKLQIEVDTIYYPVKTPLIFFGNNQLQLADLNLKIAKQAALGKVAGVVVAKSDKLSLFKMLWQLIRGNLEHTPDVYSFAADEVKIHANSKKLTVAVDGELKELYPPLCIKVHKHALKIMVPNVSSSF
ncbi:diacylglycerol kinase [Acinetobacter cumulans]|uniref:Diacylglycerol kinase n=1 Tax=Acinetobacter cumulans TaxID=2136182 RepID=A0A498CVR5_9GAMM|nr:MULTISPECIES: diacylglycerol kinase family protein [Acinetobacter]QCO21533.1 diacylglycerol kinase [Acinetobacter cumulans]RFS27962.1 diacylglycerol kinase [Acinetobacter sp. SWAC5]RKG45322.1 diacylglycerol kinase [Acinetobacter cumulans]RLL34264.1 diacylglycerol kinase [Acinetobacter cumulans]RLL44472.1 diacylglycerol kinase [Acinetobacter cumulans]